MAEKTAPLRKRMAEIEAPYRKALLEQKKAMLTPTERAVHGDPREGADRRAEAAGRGARDHA